MIPIRTKEDKNRTVEILTNAIFDAPNLSWIFLNRTKKNLAFFFLTILNDAIAKNGAFLSSNRNGVLFFYNISDRRISRINIFRKIIVLIFITGLVNGFKIIKHNRNMSRFRPKTGWLGMLMATENNNFSAAFEIYSFINNVYRKSKLPVYAETTSSRVCALYKAAGFSEYFKLKHPFANLEVWFLRKECI